MKKEMMTHAKVKVVLNRKAYYFARYEHLQNALNSGGTDLQLLANASFAVDLDRNVLIKCRYTIEDMLDSLLT